MIKPDVDPTKPKNMRCAREEKVIWSVQRKRTFAGAATDC